MATIRDVAEVVVKINDDEAKSKLPELEKKADEIKAKFNKCFADNDTKGIKKTAKELKEVYREMDKVRTRTMKIEDALEHLSDATPKELRTTLKFINAELDSGRIKRGTKLWDEYNEKLKQVKAELKKIADEQKVVTDAGLSFKDMLDIGGNLSMIFGSFIDMKDTVADFVRDNSNSYIELEAEMANVQKYTGMTREEVEMLNEELKKIDTRTSIIELNKLAEEAGRLGKKSLEDVLGFVKAADIINVALDDLGEGATLEISKLTNIFGDEKALGTEKSMLAVGSVINELSQNCTAAAPYLANFTKRLAGVGAQADMTIPQIMGFAAVLDSQGQAVEMSATAVSQLITKMFQDPAKIAKAVGLDIQEFTNLVKTDTNAALLTLLERLNSFGSMDVLAPLFKEMGTDGARASAVLASLAGNIDMVREQQEIATQAYNEATSVVKEFTVQNETEEAKLEKKRKKLEEVKVALGEKLLPVMSSFTSTGTMMIKTLNALLDVFNENKNTIINTGSAILAYIAYIKLKNLWTQKEIILDKLKVFWNNKVLTGLKSLNNTIKANKFGLLIAAVVFLISRLRDLDNAQSKVNHRMQEMKKIESEAKNNYQEEVNQIKALRNVLEDNNAEIGARRSALKRLQEIVPDYHASLTNEGKLISNNTMALENYVQSLKVAAEQQLASSKLAEIQTQKKEFWEGLGENRQNRYTQTLLNKQLNPGMSDEEAAAQANMSPAVWRVINNNLKEYDKKIEIYNSILAAKTSEMAIIQSKIQKVEIEKEKGNNNKTLVGDDTKKAISLAEQAAKEKWERQRAIENAAYSRGELTYQEHVARLQLAEQQYLDDCKAAYEQRNLTEEQGYLQLLERQKQLLENQGKELLNITLDDLEHKRQKEQDEVLRNCYDTNSIIFGNEKLRDQRLFEINIDYLRKKAELYREKAMSQEAHQIEIQIEQAETNEKLRKQKEYANKLQQWRKEYSRSSSEMQKQAELKVLDEMYKAGLVKEEEFQKLRKAIENKYTKDEKFSDGGYGDMLTNMYTSLSDIIGNSTDSTVTSLQKIGTVAQATWSIAGAALEQYTAYSQACCELEVAQIERKYEKQIAAAGKNSAKAKKLEEQKEKEIAKVKNKYNQQAQKIEIAQAIASSAMAAINAYSSAAAVPVVGYILAPIAAAMALAAGAMQIATIKKQHQVQQAGYYGGGFTKHSADDREQVGVVHANEFVANAKATRNKALMPFFSLIDYAQRNNTIGSLTEEDVSYAIGTGAVIKAATTTANESRGNSSELLDVAGSLSRNSNVIQKLNDKLDEGIETFMVMDGENGFANKWQHYERLRKNAKR